MSIGTSYFLYSVGDGVILMHDMSKPNEPALNFDNILPTADNVASKQVTLFPFLD